MRNIRFTAALAVALAWAVPSLASAQTFTASYGVASVALNTDAPRTFTITNPTATILSGGAFYYLEPANMSHPVTQPNFSGCGSINSSISATEIDITSITVAAGATCVVSLPVRSAVYGIYGLSSASLTYTGPGGSPLALTAGAQPTITIGTPPTPVPTLSEWAMILFGTILAGGAALYIQRRRLTA